MKALDFKWYFVLQVLTDSFEKKDIRRKPQKIVTLFNSIFKLRRSSMVFVKKQFNTFCHIHNHRFTNPENLNQISDYVWEKIHGQADPPKIVKTSISLKRK